MVLKILNTFLRSDKLLNIGQEIKGYKIKKKLGEGRYGIAYLAYSSIDEKVVIKKLKKGMIRKCMDKLKYEEEVLK